MIRASFVCTLLLLTVTVAARAEIPTSINYQGYLSDATGSAVDSELPMTFTLYAAESGSAPLWTNNYVVNVQSGLFSVSLSGSDVAFSDGLFDVPLWLGIEVNGDSEMTPRRALTSAAYSFKSGDSERLQGQEASSLDQSDEVADLNLRLASVEDNQAPPTLECVWSSCRDTPVANGARCSSIVPGFPILGGLDIAVDPDQKPVGCNGTNQEDELRLYCCRLVQP